MSKVKNLIKDLQNANKKGVAWLIDPEKDLNLQYFDWVRQSDLDLIFVGGSTSNPLKLEQLITSLKQKLGDLPICIFPGSYLQICPAADAVLFLSLISGRNPEYLIGQQVKAAEDVVNSGIEVLPTGYILVNEGEILSVHSTSQTLPLLNSQVEVITQTALAGKLMGMKYIFLDAGSGALKPVCRTVIKKVKQKAGLPLIVGGGLNSPIKVKEAFESGADLVVIGNGVEKDPDLLAEVLNLKKVFNLSLNIN